MQNYKKGEQTIASLRPEFIKLPSNREEILSTQEGFFNITRFPRILAALDCTHIKILSLGGITTGDYRNRRGLFSLNVQVMCSSDLKFEDIVIRWTGSTHDNLIFSNSATKFQFDSNRFQNGVILGDSGYFLNYYSLTPLSDPQTEVERLYNESHIGTRNVIERCFGIWKRSNNEREPPVDPEVHILPPPHFESIVADQPDSQRNRTRDSMIDYFESLIYQQQLN